MPAQHSPTGVMQAKSKCMLVYLPTWKHFCEYVSSHIIYRTIDEVNSMFVNLVLDEIITNVDVFRAHVVLI